MCVGITLIYQKPIAIKMSRSYVMIATRLSLLALNDPLGKKKNKKREKSKRLSWVQEIKPIGFTLHLDSRNAASNSPGLRDCSIFVMFGLSCCNVSFPSCSQERLSLSGTFLSRGRVLH